MWELRWVLLGLGALLIVGVYAWGQGWLGRVERALRRLKAGAIAAPAAAVEKADGEAAPEDPKPGTADVERIVTVRFVAKSAKKLKSDEVILALRAAGLRHGRYGIFHKVAEPDGGDPLFSVANLTEPGSFDLQDLSESTIPGMSFFMVLPGPGDPVARFDLMVGTARDLARDLDAELHDEKGSSWSIQRERYLREELIQYRHQLDRAL